MNEYHKIMTAFMRDRVTNHILPGVWTWPEFEYLKDNDWWWTEKVDGTNIRINWDGKDVTFGGRTNNAQIPNGIINRLNELFYQDDRKILLTEMFPDMNPDSPGVTFLGEGYGAKIQKVGSLYLPGGQDFILFDINIGGIYLERNNVKDIADKLGLITVPTVGYGTLMEAVEFVETGFNSVLGDGDFLAEGLVIRPTVELRNRRGARIITKIKHCDFLLKK